MECKFFSHGIAISYNNIVKPCCDWQVDQGWYQNNHINQVDLARWHQSPQVLSYKNQLSQGIWPDACRNCKNLESQGREDSTRGGGNRAYSHYQPGDITLEIRPGATCNFACQTCWPEASSRVAQYQSRAGMIDINNLDTNRIDDFEFLRPIASRIKDVIVLGGEPFYDKSCKKFIEWARNNLSSRLLMFTNGSCLDFDFLENYQGKICLVFSLDAVGKPAEYIRFGTVWSEVLENYQRARMLNNVEVRVNVTTSIYSFWYLESLLEFLCRDWPDLVTFGPAKMARYREDVIPQRQRDELIRSLSRAQDLIMESQIEKDQQSNAFNAIGSVINNLKTLPWNPDSHHLLKDYVSKMDKVKDLALQDYCPELAGILFQETD